MTAKDHENVESIFPIVKKAVGILNLSPHTIRNITQALIDYAPELRAALLTFDASAFVVVGWQYKNNWGDWVNGTESHCEIMQSVHGFKIRQIYAAPEAT